MLNPALLRVSIYRQGELVGREVFRERHIVIGRDPTMADLVIGSVQVSREHALLEHDGQHVFLHDLESTNGIYVNGEKVRSAEISPRDRVFVGEHLLRLELRVARISERSAAEAAASDDRPLQGSPIPTLVMPQTATQVISLDPPAEPQNGVDRNEPAWLPPPLPSALSEDDAGEPEIPLAALVMGDRVTLPESEDTPMCVSVCKTRGEQVVDLALVQPGRPYRAADPHVRERWGIADDRRIPLAVQLDGKACLVEMPGGQRWSLRRAGEAASEALGVREGWVRRRRSAVTVTVRRGELLLVEMGAATYHVRFVPVPKAFRWARDKNRHSRILLWAGALSAMMHIWMLAGAGLWGSPHWAPAWRPPAAASSIDIRVVPRRSVAQNTPPALPTAVASFAGPTPRVPGGPTGFAVLGLADVPPTDDPTLPAASPTAGPHLKRVAAFLRGKAMGFGSLLPAGSGPAWRLVVDEGRPPMVSPARAVDPAALLKLLAKSESALAACYQKNTPTDSGLTARIELAFSIAPNGAVANVDAASAPVEANLMGCLRQVMTRWRLSRHKGEPAAAASYIFVFQRTGFE